MFSVFQFHLSQSISRHKSSHADSHNDIGRGSFLISIDIVDHFLKKSCVSSDIIQSVIIIQINDIERTYVFPYIGITDIQSPDDIFFSNTQVGYIHIRCSQHMARVKSFGYNQRFSYFLRGVAFRIFYLYLPSGVPGRSGYIRCQVG